jgi:hypothetical protein
LLVLSGTLTLSAPTDVPDAPYRSEHVVEHFEGMDMAQGLTSNQEIVEVRLDNFMRGSIKDALTQELAARPEHRIVALSTIAGGDEFNGVIRVVAVIEYL